MNSLFRFVLLAVLTLSLAGCNDSWTWHQKITVSVSTPEGIKTASSVMKAGIAAKGGWWAPPEASGAVTSLSGEAVVLEVAPGKYLFALLRGTPQAYEVFFPNDAPLETARKLNASLGARILSPAQYPLLVTFDDVRQPGSVKPVDPVDMVKSFGLECQLISISMEITDEAVSHGQVAKLLRWLPDYYDKQLDGQRTIYLHSGNRFANSLAAGDFDTERQ